MMGSMDWSLEKEMGMSADKTEIGGLQISIILLTAATALVHFFWNFPNIVFILNCLGYLGLLAALYLPTPMLQEKRGLARYGLMGFASLTILAWIALGDKHLATGYVGYIDKTVEIVLILLLWVENQKSQS
jgi:hypothetical protein